MVLGDIYRNLSSVGEGWAWCCSILRMKENVVKIENKGVTVVLKCPTVMTQSVRYVVQNSLGDWYQEYWQIKYSSLQCEMKWKTTLLLGEFGGQCGTTTKIGSLRVWRWIFSAGMDCLIPPEPVTLWKVISAVTDGPDRRRNPCRSVINGTSVTYNGPDRLHSLFGVNGTLAKCQLAARPPPLTKRRTRSFQEVCDLQFGLAQGKAGHLLNVLLLFTYTSEDKWARWHFNPSTFAFPSHCLQFIFTSRYYSSFMKQIPRSVELIEFLFCNLWFGLYKY